MLAAVPLARLDDVGIQRALDQEARLASACRRRPSPRRSTPRSRATSSKIRMNSSPMILRLRLGVGHPGQRRRRSGRPPSRGRGRPGTGGGRSSSTWSASPARIRPVSTKTQVSWSPMALCTSAAATAESTPPRQRAQHAVGTHLGPHRGHLLLDDRDVRPRRQAAADVDGGSCSNSSLPRSVCTTSGWNCTPKMRAIGVVRWRPPAHPGWSAVATNPSGTAVMASPWLIHTVRRRPASPGRAARRPVTRQRRCGRTRPARCATRCPRAAGHELGAVADARGSGSRGRRSPGRWRAPASRRPTWGRRRR